MFRSGLNKDVVGIGLNKNIILIFYIMQIDNIWNNILDWFNDRSET